MSDRYQHGAIVEMGDGQRFHFSGVASAALRQRGGRVAVILRHKESFITVIRGAVGLCPAEPFDVVAPFAPTGVR